MTDQAPAKLSYANVPMEAAGQGGSLAPKNLGDVVAFASVMARAGAAIPASTAAPRAPVRRRRGAPPIIRPGLAIVVGTFGCSR